MVKVLINIGPEGGDVMGFIEVKEDAKIVRMVFVVPDYIRDRLKMLVIHSDERNMTEYFTAMVQDKYSEFVKSLGRE